MTPAELEAAADELAAQRNDPRTPAVVRRALLEPGCLTLRDYLALEQAGSPLLAGAWPTEDPAAMAQAFCTAHAIVFPGREIPPPQALAGAIEEMEAVVSRGLSTVMAMRFRKPPGTPLSPESPDGLGWVARLLGRFAARCWKPDDVLDLPMDQLFILSAAIFLHEGAECAGVDYRERL
jgi:hypothetical protein